MSPTTPFRALLTVALLAPAAACTGCGGGGGGGAGAVIAPVTSAPGGSAAAGDAFVALGLAPEAAPAATTAELVLTFSRPVDLAALRLGETLVVVEDTDDNPGGTFAPLPGDLSPTGPDGREVAFAPRQPFREHHEVRLVLTAGVRALDGAPLAPVPGGAPLGFGAQVPDAVHELRFAPLPLPVAPALPTSPVPAPAPAQPAPAPPAQGSTPPGVRPSAFQPLPGTDVWHVDFEARAALLDDDFARHGLRSGDAATDRLARELVIGQALSWAAQKYGLTSRGEAVPGQSWRVSFTAASPGGAPGGTHSRHACGGRHVDSTSILGAALYDPGNQGREDNARAGRLGIFPRVIFGRRSTLDPALRASDRRFLDGTYVLGAGSADDDARLDALLRVAADWGHALGSVIAHEAGHSVGLPHDESDALGLMRAATGAQTLSDPRTRFSGPSAARLDQNLGKH